MALPFFPDVFYLSMAVIGALIIDFDRKLINKNLIMMAGFGAVLSLVLYLLNLPLILGVILITLAFIFFISRHRGFMHSIFGIIVITAFLSFLILGFYLLLGNFMNNLKVILIIISLVLGILIINKRLIIPFVILVPIGIGITPNSALNAYHVIGAVFIGCLSHIILDLLTPSGVRLFSPLSSKKYRKRMGIFLLVVWVFASVFYFFNYLVF